MNEYVKRRGKKKEVELLPGDRATIKLSMRKGAMIQNYMDLHVTEDGGIIIISEIQIIVLPRTDNSVALRAANPPIV